ncbi:MAG: transposase [Alkaliphilus sp.]|nr:transposase [Alkaliphilus sp.]
MIKSVKVRLLPTKEQEELMFKSVGTARYAYNWGLAKWQELYKEGVKPNSYAIKKEFNNTIKTQDKFKWLYEVSAKITAQAFDDLQDAFNNFFEGTAKYPKFKSRKKSKQSFYVRYDRMNIKNNTANIEKIGRVRFTTNYNIPKLRAYVNPRCSYDGKYWYLTFGFEQGENQVELNPNLSVGIDLGIKDLAVVNCLDEPIKNINKSKEVKRLKKKIKRLKRKCSRKYEMNKINLSEDETNKDKTNNKNKTNKDGTRFIKTKNIIKLENEIRLIHRKLTNIRNNHIHQATNKIIKLRPKRVVIENLNISGMMKNKYLAEKIQEQKLYEFIRQIEYKCKFNGIELVKADRWFPSSKMCSNCGNIKKDLKLEDRVYVCQCGLEIDRDKNASINLGNYKVS